MYATLHQLKANNCECGNLKSKRLVYCYFSASNYRRPYRYLSKQQLWFMILRLKFLFKFDITAFIVIAWLLQ